MSKKQHEVAINERKTMKRNIDSAHEARGIVMASRSAGGFCGNEGLTRGAKSDAQRLAEGLQVAVQAQGTQHFVRGSISMPTLAACGVKHDEVRRNPRRRKLLTKNGLRSAA